MKRKRFVRLLMARGIQRNEAERIARTIGAYGSYAEMYESLRLWLAMRSLTVAMRGVAKSVVAAEKTISNAFGALVLGVDLSEREDCTAVASCARREDAIDALTYSVRYMNRAEHAELHRLDGYNAGVVLYDETHGKKEVEK